MSKRRFAGPFRRRGYATIVGMRFLPFALLLPGLCLALGAATAWAGGGGGGGGVQAVTVSVPQWPMWIALSVGLIAALPRRRP